MQKLGIDLIQILAQLANFAIVLVVLKKFLHKPVLGFLQKRKELIDEGLKLQEQMEKKLKQLEETERELTRQGTIKADKLARQSQKEAQEASRVVLEIARKKAQTIRQQARKEAEREILAQKSRYESRIVQEATTLANQAMKKLLGKDVRFQLTESQIRAVRRIEK